MKALLSRALLWTLTLAGIAWSPALAHAQVRYGSIVVEARDPSGSAVPGADVTITETGTNRSRSGVTNSAGVVTFATIPPGTVLGPRQPHRLQRVCHDRRRGHRRHGDARQQPARSGTDHRNHDRLGRRGDPADRPRRSAHRHPGGAAREPAGAGRPQLSEPVRHGARHLAAREHALGRGQPGARPGLQLEWHDPQRELDPDRGRDLEQPLAPARGRLCAGARGDRIGRRDHQHLRRGSGPVGRHVGQRPDQERHQRVSRLRVRVLL